GEVVPVLIKIGWGAAANHVGAAVRDHTQFSPDYLSIRRRGPKPRVTRQVAIDRCVRPASQVHVERPSVAMFEVFRKKQDEIGSDVEAILESVGLWGTSVISVSGAY